MWIVKWITKIIKVLCKEYYFLFDPDITQDFAGAFNKREMINYLIANFDFCVEGEVKR